MVKKTLFTLLLSVAVSLAAVKELVPNLTSENMEVQSKARLDLLAVCSEAGKPGNEDARKAVCLEICQLLETKQPAVEVMHQLLLNLERIGGAESVPTLAKLLNHKEEFIRDDARRALVVNPSEEAALALGTHLKKRKARSSQETAGLITALAERKQAGASNLITGALGSSDEDVFYAAVKALGRLNEPAGIQALVTQRAKEDGFRKTQIDAALFSSGNKEVLEKLYADGDTDQVRAVALLNLMLLGDAGKAAEAMASGVAGLQVAIIEAALQSKSTEAYDVIAANLGTLPHHIQLRAVAALEFSGNKKYASSVEPLLKSGDIMIQDTAARALAKIGTAGSVEALMANGRGDARRALGQLNIDGVDEALEAIAATGSDDNSRAVAIEVLAMRGRRDLIPQFFDYAASGSPATAKAAVMAIGKVGDFSNVDALADLMIAKESDRLSRDILGVIVDILRASTETVKAVDVLVLKMDGASPRSQSNILQAMAQSGSMEAMEPILDACRSPDEKLQKLAVKLLAAWPSMNGLEYMLELASDESLSLANHVTLMRGVSRLYAAEPAWRLKKDEVQTAMDVCRRPEERDALKATYDKAKR
jgi:HEAT repeat protein